MTPETLTQTLRNLLENPKPATGFSLTDSPVTAQDHQIGGPGWGLAHERHVVDAAGTPLAFLAQVNLSTFRAHLPESPLSNSLLQFFVHPDITTCKYPTIGQNSGGFLVRALDPTTQLTPLDMQTPLDFLRWDSTKAKRLTPYETTILPSPNGMELNLLQEEFMRILRQNGYERPWESHQFSAFEELMDSYFGDVKGNTVYTGGYPGFTQGDPRIHNTALFHHTLCLINLEYSDDICIGDAGEMHFLLDTTSWEQGNLQGIIYNWDCF